MQSSPVSEGAKAFGPNILLYEKESVANMKLTLNGIKETAAWEAAGIKLPSYSIEQVTEETKKAPVWVHFGAGNIFRIFIGGLADRLIAQGEMKKGITCVETFDFDVVDKIYKPYDNLVLAVTLKADGSTDKQVIGSLTEAIKAQSNVPEEWNRLKEIFTDPGLQMISFTITEKGYALKNAEGNYFPFVQADIDNGPEKPGAAMAVVCALLFERFKAGKHPLAVVSMDNCSHNGEKLQNSILTMAKEWEKKGFVGADFVAYLSDEKQISFPWSMIDKITPRPADSVCRELEKAGVEDIAPVITSKKTYIAPFVNAEGPQYLVIEDKFPNGREALEAGGLMFTDRETVDKVEKMKVCTCLNPLHTALAIYGCLLGYDKISEEMKDDDLRKMIEIIGYKEGLPVVVNPGILDPKKFIKTVLEVRLPNPFMPDTPQRIATDTSQKLAIRFGETIKAYMASDELEASDLKLIPLVFAGWLRYLMAVDDNGNAFEPSSDPMLAELTPYLKDIKWNDEQAEKKILPILAKSEIFGVNLAEAGLLCRVVKYFKELIAGVGAVRTTLHKYVSNN